MADSPLLTDRRWRGCSLWTFLVADLSQSQSPTSDSFLPTSVDLSRSRSPSSDTILPMSVDLSQSRSAILTLGASKLYLGNIRLPLLISPNSPSFLLQLTEVAAPTLCLSVHRPPNRNNHPLTVRHFPPALKPRADAI
jgi:hypothetical protein